MNKRIDSFRMARTGTHTRGYEPFGLILIGMAILIFISCVVFHLSPVYLAVASVVIGIAGGNVYVDIIKARRA
jgi:hypothetical protein